MIRDRVRALLATPSAPAPPPVGPRDWVLLGLVMAAMVVEASVRTALPGRWISLAVGLAAAPLLLVRRRHPGPALVVLAGAGLLHSLVELARGAPVPTLDTFAFVLVLLYALVRWGSGREIALGMGVLVASAVAGIAVTGASGGTGIAGGDAPLTVRLAGDLLGSLVVLGGIVELALVVRRLDARRRHELDAAAARERRELARELHDTVAHHVSAIAVLAQGAQAVAAAGPGRPDEVLARIEDEASTALAEMRALVRVLREEETGVLAPQPGLDELRGLADPGGQPAVRVEVGPGAERLPGPLPATLFRLAREAVTNARSHARGASLVTVRLTADADAVRLTVHDDGRGVPAPQGAAASGARGFGLTGMAERARLVGGVCRAGPGHDGGWTVDAVLPRDGGPS